MNKYSVSQWIYGGEPLTKSLARLQKFGYQGIELSGNDGSQNQLEIKQALGSYGLEASSICGSYPADRDLAADSPVTRQHALDYVKRNLDYAAEVGANKLIVVPSSVGKLAPDSSYAKSWDQGLESLRVATEYAEKNDVKIILEAVNRYETFLVPNLATAKYFAELIDSPALGLMADLYHMSLEERDSLASLELIKDKLIHVHLADSTREGVGYGNLDFLSILTKLKEINYAGYLTMEFLIRDTTRVQPYLQPDGISLADEFTRHSIDYLNNI